MTRPRKKSRRKRDSNPGSSALEEDALTTRPTWRSAGMVAVVGWLLSLCLLVDFEHPSNKPLRQVYTSCHTEKEAADQYFMSHPVTVY